MFKHKIGLLLAALLIAMGLSGCAYAAMDDGGDGVVEQFLSQVAEAVDDASESSVTRMDSEEVSDGWASSDGVDEGMLSRDGEYTSKDEVALYLHTFGELPSNFITKKEAAALGWEGGSLEPYAPGKSIGGDYFGNYEGILPKKKGREYHECDIDTKGADKRGAKRIVYSNDGLIYYTEDHYETYELLYGNE